MIFHFCSFRRIEMADKKSCEAVPVQQQCWRVVWFLAFSPQDSRILTTDGVAGFWQNITPECEVCKEGLNTVLAHWGSTRLHIKSRSLGCVLLSAIIRLVHNRTGFLRVLKGFDTTCYDDRSARETHSSVRSAKQLVFEHDPHARKLYRPRALAVVSNYRLVRFVWPRACHDGRGAVESLFPRKHTDLYIWGENVRTVRLES